MNIEKIAWFCLGGAFVLSVLIVYVVYWMTIFLSDTEAELLKLIFGLGIFLGIIISATARFLVLSFKERKKGK